MGKHRTGPCSVCGKVGRIDHGMCGPHYNRWRRHGDPFGGSRAFKGEGEAWLRIVAEAWWPVCIDWPYGLDIDGYGQITVNDWHGKASTLVCIWRHGERPPGMVAAHWCGRRICVNWRHLRWTTVKDNESDKIGHGTANYEAAAANLARYWGR